MRAVFNHTWKLLSSREQGIMRGLSIFRGGFSRQAANVVAGASLPDMKTLASKWLVERDHQGRFILHELLRQYLAERLDENLLAKNNLEDKHLMFYANFLRERSGDLEGNEPKQALAEIGSEIDNIRAAWSWALNQRNLEAIAQSLEGLARFYVLSARYQEGESAFAQASELLIMTRATQDWDEKNNLLLGKTLIRLGLCYGMQGLVCQTREALRKGLDLLQDSGDRKELAYALLYLANWQTTTEEERVLLDKALAIFTDINERKGIAYVHTALGYILFSQGNFQKARQFFYEGLEIHRQLANQRDIASALGDLGYIHWIMGAYPEALRYSQESLDIMEEQNDKEGIASTYNLLALVFGSWKDYAKAKEFIWKRFHVSKETGNLSGIAVSLANIAECELMEGNDEEAYRLAKESYPYFNKIDERLTNAVWYFRPLGESECGLGLLKEGKFHLRHALDIQVKQNELSGATHTMVAIARYFERIGQKERAFELLGLAIYHSGSWQWVKERATTLVEKFKQEYPLEAVNTALERGRTLGLKETATALLNELEEEGSALPL
jgi:tetratricopeptide (TPR) repeat protein